MSSLSSPRVVKEIIEKHQFKFSKGLGQNFLIDDNILDKIVEGADITENDVVIEVGPGIGTLTQHIAETAKKVVAIEIDDRLIPILKETLGEYDNIEVVHGDVLKVDLKTLIKEHFGDQKPKVVANLPYYVTTPIIMRFLEESIPVSDLVVMIQKEVADRMVSESNCKAYGALSVAVQYYCKPMVVTKVPPSVFIPQPKVESTVIRLQVREEPAVTVENTKIFFNTVKSGFGKRRKTLLNALSSGNLGLGKEQVKEALEQAGIDPKRRAESLDIEEFAVLANALHSIKQQN